MFSLSQEKIKQSSPDLSVRPVRRFLAGIWEVVIPDRGHKVVDARDNCRDRVGDVTPG
jgi:hypothetical protein